MDRGDNTGEIGIGVGEGQGEGEGDGAGEGVGEGLGVRKALYLCDGESALSNPFAAIPRHHAAAI